MLISDLFKPVVKRDPKTGAWTVPSNSMRGMEEALDKCRRLNELDQELADRNGVTAEDYRQTVLKYGKG